MLRKRWIALAGMSVAATSIVAWAATSYQVQTKLVNSGGTLKLREKAVQTSGLAYNNFTTSANVPITVTAKEGYSIASITQTGQPTVYNPTSPWSGNFVKSRGTIQALGATFAVNKYTVSTSTTGDGSITPSPAPAVSYNGSVTLTACPKYTNSYISGYTVNPPDQAYTASQLDGGKLAITLTGVKADSSVSVNFGTVSVSAGSNKVAVLNTETTIGGTSTGSGTLAWAVTSKPTGATVGLTNATTAMPGFTADKAGRYTLTVTDTYNGRVLATSSMQVEVVASLNDAMRVNCNGCHNPVSGAVPSLAFGKWSTSAHKADGINCVSCHTDGAMPSPVNTATVNPANFRVVRSAAGTVGTNYCAKCHSTIAIRLHDADAKNDCAACHGFDAHSLARTVVAGSVAEPHVGGAVAPGHAQYLSAGVTCDNCHTGNQAAILAEYRRSGHGNPAGEAWAHYDWRLTSRAACQRCHNGTVFAARLDGAALNASTNFFAPYSTAAKGKAGEVLNCSACHSDVATGELRAATNAFAINASNAATISYDVPGASSLCVRCHGGRESGDSIKLSTGDFSDLSFINSHYLAAGGVVYTKSGYEYAGQTYDTLGYHMNVGKEDAFGTGTAGPCVACHMSAGNGHTWEFVSKDGNGHITANNSTVCVNCHDGLTGAALEAVKEEYEAALDALKTALAAKGILFYNAHPYFYKDLNGNGVYDAATESGSANAFKNWEGVYPGKGKDVMGAAFNYNLLVHEPGAYAHNKQYALKLIADSCDLLADGVIDGAGIPAAVTTARSSRAFADATGHPAPIVAAGTSTDCAACHVPAPHYGGTAFLKAQYVSAASRAISCADCHGQQTKTTDNQAILAQFAGSGHGNPAGEAWRHYDWRSGNRSACARCHTGTAFAAKLGNENNTGNVFLPGDLLKPGEALTCSACHTDAGTGELRVAPGDFTINMRNGATVTYDVAGASTLCARCHSGRETGESIKADTDVTGVRAFIDSHYQPVAGTVYNNAGYEYAGQSYDSLGSHKLLGASSQGPCVTCHMPGKNHGFVAASCGTCHDGVTVPAVNASDLKTSYDAALNNLKLALQAKGIHYAPVHPFFYTAPYVAGSPNTPFTNWASVYGAQCWKDTMGAAFNYNLLWSEKGAYAHNYDYAMKLIADSIDFLSDGTVGGQ